ncbi:unnamed protein product [Rotaria sordida]|uniref:C2 domain-containing protein n=1 Tax=Rotaria sordida TaxID=392033 RepID=A0A819CSX2_9BILA|nr:unnamed protein product [Rotaria sordida]
MNAIRSCWPQSNVNGCFFHLTQNIYRQVQQAGFTIKYGNDEEYAHAVRMLPALAFLKTNDIFSTFEDIDDLQIPDLDPLYNYFEDSYIVSNIDISNSKLEIIGKNNDQSTSDMPTTQFINDEDVTLLSAKVIFRGVNLWSNNVRIRAGTANFIARGNKPKKFNFNLATMLIPDDKLRIEFYTINMNKKRKKLIAIFELMLESLIDSKYIDLPEENLSDPNNSLLPATVQLKLYYTPPDIDKQLAAIGYDDTSELIDWRNIFDDEGRHGGHRYRHMHSKHDGQLTKLRRKLAGHADDADIDTCSDSDFEVTQDSEKKFGSVDKSAKIKMQHNDLELLEKSLGRYVGDVYEMTEWQLMVHIIQARDLPGLNISPYVSVQIDNQKRYTSVQKSCNSPYFGEFFTFDFTLPTIKFMEKVIIIKVHDTVRIISTFTDTAPIGIFRLDVSTVYSEKEHAFERKWAQLVNPENIGSSCGHLLLSISVTQRGVPTKNFVSEGVHDEDEFKPSKTLIPAAMPRHLFPMQLKIIFFTATELPEMMTDFLATVSKKILQSHAWEPVDPYVEVTYDTMTVATEARNGTTPIWGEALYLIGRFPPLVRTIKITLKDRASVQKDRIISSFFIDLFLISESNPSIGFLPTLGPTWIFLYGSPREYTISKDKDGLSEGMGEAVCYKGRILMAIESHPVTTENTPNMNIQKETDIKFPEAHIFPMKRSFLLFGCIYDVSMINKSFGNGTISFELSIGPSGYLNPQKLVTAIHNPVSSLTRAYQHVSIDNNKDYFRLPIDLQKPILFTKYIFHDYIYRMTLSNRLKNASAYLYEQICEFELKIDSKISNEILIEEYRKIQYYIHTLPCGCAEHIKEREIFGTTPVVHSNLYELLNSSQSTLKMNQLDIKRFKKILNNIQSIKTWISKEINFDVSQRYKIIKELNKIAHAFQQMATDAQPSLPDIFLWMICDSKRVAYARFQPEDLLFNLCKGEKGLYNGRVQTIFLKTPRSTDKPLNPSTNAKVQIYLWLGIEEHQPSIFKHLPAGFDMPPLPLHPQLKFITYNERTFYELRCHCYKARALITADATGLSDPYLSVTVGNETQTAPILLESLCPQWNVTLAFQNLVHVGSRETAEEIIGNVVVECYDYDEENDESGRKSDKEEEDGLRESDLTSESPSNRKHGNESLTTLEKIKINDMEKTAGWWHKYYASKAKLKLMRRCAIDMDESLKDRYDAYAGFFEDKSTLGLRKGLKLWNRAKKIFLHVGKAQKILRNLAAERMEWLEDSEKSKSVVDESLELIETNRLKELTLLQTFDIIETELENVYDYEGFNDCLDTFPLYRGKGSSRSDEVGDEKRVYAKFKGKFRIQEISRNGTNCMPPMSINRALSNPQMKTLLKSKSNSNIPTNQLMLQLDFNKNPITLKCRLYIIKALLYRSWDPSGKADPFIKIVLNNDTIIDDVDGKLPNTLEPIFGKSYEFDVQLPFQSLIRIQIWDWDMTSFNDMVGETKIDIENRWFSCHRATCGLPKRYDSAGYNTWRDTKKPTIILTELCRTTNINVPDYAADFRSVTVDDKIFECDPECIEFVMHTKSSVDILYRKAYHESTEEYIRQNTALAALHAWGRKINQKCALVAEHIECRSLFNPEFPGIEQGKLEMWLDFFPMSRSPSNAMIDITPPKPTSYQLRIIIWNTTDVELDDQNFLTGEKTSDIYVTAWILGERVDAQQTDIHYRSLTGEGNFNWRFLFDFDYLDIEEKIVFQAKDSVFQLGNTTKKIPPKIIIRVYDADFFSADDFLGECVLNLTHVPLGTKVPNKCKADILLNPKHRAINLFATKRIAGWWPMIAPLKEGEIRDKTLLGGKFEAEFSLVTAEEAEKNPVGKAREPPQPLEKPNRPTTSFLWFTSPWKTLRYVVWRNFKWAIILGVLIFIGVIFLLLAIWTIPGEIVSQVATKIFKNK